MLNGLKMANQESKKKSTKTHQLGIIMKLVFNSLKVNIKPLLLSSVNAAKNLLRPCIRVTVFTSLLVENTVKLLKLKLQIKGTVYTDWVFRTGETILGNSGWNSSRVTVDWGKRNKGDSSTSAYGRWWSIMSNLLSVIKLSIDISREGAEKYHKC